MNMLDVRGVSVQYRRAAALALDSITFTMGAGEIVALTGDNGAGKSTLMSVLNGSLRASAGSVYVNGVETTAKPAEARRLTATMSQSNSSFRGITPRQAIRNAATVRGLSHKQAGMRCQELLEALQMVDSADRPGEVLSGGMRRLTKLAVALVQDVPVYLLDEPTNDVSPTRRPLIWQLLSEMSKAGKTFLVSTHNLDEAMRHTSRQIAVSAGVKVQDGALGQRVQRRDWSVVMVPSDVQLPAEFEELAIARDPAWIQLAVPREEDALPRLLDDLRGLSTTVMLQQRPSEVFAPNAPGWEGR